MRSTIKITLTAMTVALTTASLQANDVRGPGQTALQPGAQVVVLGGIAPLMRGYRTLATVPGGQRLAVLEVRGPWVGTAVTRQGRRIAGWVWYGQVTTPERFAARPPAVRRYSYQPVQPMESVSPRSGPYPYAANVLPPDMRDYYTGGLRSGSPLVMGATRYGRNYWRADRKIIGY